MQKNGSIHWAWIILATCFVNLFINYSVRLGYSVVLPEMIRDLGFNRTAAGSIFNAYLFSYILLTPLTGFLTDRFGGRRVITTCAFILGAGILLMGTAKSLWTACVFYAVVGLGATGMWTPVITLWSSAGLPPIAEAWPWGCFPPGMGWALPQWGSPFPGLCTISTGAIPGIFWEPGHW